MNLKEKDVENVIDILISSDSFNVTKLAEYLKVSRSVLYKNFRHLLPKPANITERKIKDSILRIRQRTGRSLLTISEVAIESGVSRQSISRDYSHLISMIKGENPVDIMPNSTTESEEKIKVLEDQISSLKLKNEEYEENIKLKVYSDMMKQDLASFTAQKDKANAIKLQNQNDEIIAINKQQISELADLRSKLSELKRNSKRIIPGCNIIAHIKPDYSNISSKMDLKTSMEIFFEIEEKNINDAIDICFTSQPNSVIFFQPFLSCNFESLDIALSKGDVVLIESSFPFPNQFKKFLLNISEIPVHSISCKGHELQLANFYCRKNHTNKFSEEFIEKLYKIISYPDQNDGFKSVTFVKPSPSISAVK
ncbi:AraC family transcriptional regulator [Vibrio cincinnatiensis]|nr:AraC family transcriptional regulator [Vibrio cincinnatiensis]MCG3733996.1 AraC family transcriptional regulator [Vibrio cincinnatiensis]